jgi:hypothetical protein
MTAPVEAGADVQALIENINSRIYNFACNMLCVSQCNFFDCATLLCSFLSADFSGWEMRPIDSLRSF